MKTAPVVAAILLSVGGVSFAQHGTAEHGYYPASYHGETWSGTLTAVNDRSREMTLSYADKKDKAPQTFIGVLQENYVVKAKDGREIELKPSMIPLSTLLTVYYNVTSKKEDGKKIKINAIFLIKGIPNLNMGQTFFKPFEGAPK